MTNAEMDALGEWTATWECKWCGKYGCGWNFTSKSEALAWARKQLCHGD